MIKYGKINPHNEEGRTGLFIRGHADYADSGADIVCAAVSAIGQTAAYGCKAFNAYTEIRHCRKGYIVFVCENGAETYAIIKAALIGLDEIKKQYPECFARRLCKA